MAKNCPLTQNDCQSNCAWYHELKKTCAFCVLADRVDDIPARLSEIEQTLVNLVDRGSKGEREF